MISWMQKHNKYLVWTIWIATIAFIGAGFVGWGSYNLGSKAGSVAKVGDIEIKQSRLNQAYGNLYNQYNQMMQGKLDEKKAKELGLVQQAFSTLEVQAKILNYAKDAGIIASDKELIAKLAEIKAFQKDGIFNREIYNRYLQSQRLKAKDFEETLKEEIVIQKTLNLLEADALPLEIETVSAAMNVADKLAYKVLTTADVNYTSDETKVKSFWENQKENYMTKKAYVLSLLWTSSDETPVTDAEIKAYYEANSFNYTNAQGKQLDFNASKALAAKDLKIKNTKKSAQKAYIAFKKGEAKSSEDITLALGDMKLTQEIWNVLQTKSVGDILKPKVVGTQYVTIKINAIEEPKVMTFEEAKTKVSQVYDTQAKKDALLTLAETTLNNMNETNAEVTDYITLEKRDNLKSLNSQESLQFLQKLFTSDKEKGIISVLDKVVVYSILDQKLLSVDENKTENVKQTVNAMKKKTFESNLIKMLDTKYPTKTYVEGLTN
jgi:peptidyl-prolyl cis-trans isomerase D